MQFKSSRKGEEILNNFGQSVSICDNVLNVSTYSLQFSFNITASVTLHYSSKQMFIPVSQSNRLKKIIAIFFFNHNCFSTYNQRLFQIINW